jgi:hypothetical protein
VLFKCLKDTCKSYIWVVGNFLQLILYISNEMSRFQIGAFNGADKVNVDTSFKILVNLKLCTQLNASILHLNNKMNHIHFI